MKPVCFIAVKSAEFGLTQPHGIRQDRPKRRLKIARRVEDLGGANLIVENTLIGIAASAGANVLQEFVMKKLTPNLPKNEPVPPTN